jgi:hypothetical protein
MTWLGLRPALYRRFRRLARKEGWSRESGVYHGLDVRSAAEADMVDDSDTTQGANGCGMYTASERVLEAVRKDVTQRAGDVQNGMRCCRQV